MHVARDSGAEVALLTAQDAPAMASMAQVMVKLPAQTMAEDIRQSAALPMGSAYEASQFFLFEYLVEDLRRRTHVTEAAMRSRHTNME